MSRTLFTLLAAILAPTALAQTWTACNPLNRTNCPVDTALGVSNYTIDLTKSTFSSRVWNTTAGTINAGVNGAEFTINKQGDSPTIQSNFYIFFGQVEIIMKAASGQGVISSVVLESDDLDEVDWEMMGGNTTHVETNYFGKGNTTTFDRAIYYPVETPQETWHNYTVDWSSEKLDWYVDGNIIRTLHYNESHDEARGGKDFPQTPMNVRLGIWAGGDPKNPNGTIEWAGGPIDYSKVPYTMEVKSIRVSDASTGTQYKYGDTSGNWQSIQFLNATKALALDGNNSASPAQTATQKWNSLSQGAKIAVLASIGGFLSIAIGLLSFCCVKQRRAGRRERAIEDAEYEKVTAELLAYKQEMAVNALKTRNVPYVGHRGYQQF